MDSILTLDSLLTGTEVIEQSIRYVFEKKYPNGFKCQKCGNEEFHHIAHRNGSRECAKCGYQESAKVNTIMFRSKIGANKWIKAIAEFIRTEGKISTKELQWRLELKNYGQAWIMKKKIERAFKRLDQTPDPKNLEALLGIILLTDVGEVDESAINLPLQNSL